MDFVISWMQQGFAAIAPFFILLGLLIFVHELGHFLVAKFYGVRVEVFSLGFGKKIFQFKKGDTVYCISLIPLGGYVKMYGDDPTAEVPEEEKKYAFLHKAVGPRIAIVLAGPLMNLFFAGLLFMGIGLIGEPVAGPQLGDIKPDSVAHTAGFRSGDKILRINGVITERWEQIKETIENSANKALEFDIDRGGEAVAISSTPTLEDNDFIFTTRSQIGKIKGLNITSTAPLVGVSDPNSLAGKAGFNTFEMVKEINGQKISYWRDLEATLSAIPQGATVEFKLQEYSAELSSKKEEAPERVVKVDNWPSPVDSSINTGIESPELFLFRIIKDSPAKEAGLQAGDKLYKINGQPLTKWEDVLAQVKTSEKDGAAVAVSFEVIRNGEVKTFSITPRLTEVPQPQGQVEKRYTVGIVPAITQSPNESVTLKFDNLGEALVYGAEKSWDWTVLVGMSFVRLIQGEVSAKNVGGVITIGVVASRSFEVGLVAFMKMMAIISVNLFLLNLLPVPVLDGGHLVFFLIEAVRGAPLSLRKMEMAQQVGLVLLISLMVFALFNDITNLMSTW